MHGVLGKCNDCSSKLCCSNIAWNNKVMFDQNSTTLCKLNALLGKYFMDMSKKRIFTLPDPTVTSCFLKIQKTAMVQSIYPQNPMHVMVSTTNLVKLPQTVQECQSFVNFLANPTQATESSFYNFYLAEYWRKSRLFDNL